MATTIDRSTLVRGPGSVHVAAQELRSVGGIRSDLQTEWQETPVDGAGDIGKTKLDEIVVTQFVPSGEITSAILAVLYPYSASLVGASVYGNADVAAHVHSKLGKKLLLHNTRVTAMPNLKLSAADTPFEQVTLTSLIRNATARSAANAVYTLSDEEWSGAALARTYYKKVPYTGVWGSGGEAVTLIAKEGWQVEFETNLNPEKTNDIGTYDMSIARIRVRARCRPVNLGETLLDLARVQGVAAAAIGSFANQGKDLVLSADVAGGLVVTLNDAGLVAGQLQWGDTELRAGEIAWESSMNLTTNAAFAIGIKA